MTATTSKTTAHATADARWQQRNGQLLAAYAQERSIDRRNAVVRANLPLVWQAARRESLRSGHSFEDLCQVGCLGLIKAVERFDLERGASLSSAAMPWIIGALTINATIGSLPDEGRLRPSKHSEAGRPRVS